MSESFIDQEIRIVPWSNHDFVLLHLMNTPKMTEYLGGPETTQQIIARHKLYLDIGKYGTGQMFSIVLLPYQKKVGIVGYWEREWQKKKVYEIGWGVLPQFQSKGIASIAVAKAIAIASSEQKHHFIHAFPSINNHTSNAICRKLNFSLVGKCDFEYPRGSFMQSNNWRLKIITK